MSGETIVLCVWPKHGMNMYIDREGEDKSWMRSVIVVTTRGIQARIQQASAAKRIFGTTIPEESWSTVESKAINADYLMATLMEWGVKPPRAIERANDV